MFQEQAGAGFELAGLEMTATLHAARRGDQADRVLLEGAGGVPPDDQPDWPLVFVETQFQHDPDFHARWFSELFLYLYRRPPRRAGRAVTVFPNRTTEGPWWEAAYEMLRSYPWVRRVYLEEALRDPDAKPGRAGARP
ncbi:MAG: DUF2887 domain-containing protein [Candidatus Competibacteraceae bacterium]